MNARDIEIAKAYGRQDLIALAEALAATGNRGHRTWRLQNALAQVKVDGEPSLRAAALRGMKRARQALGRMRDT